jgi:hypothetical protein
MYGSLIPLSTYEKDCFCVFADYTITGSDSASLINSCRKSSPQGDLPTSFFLTPPPPAAGELISSSGTLKGFDPQEPGEFLVLMDSQSSAESNFWIAAAHLFGGNYRVMKLGPLNSDELYDWAGELTTVAVIRISSPLSSFCSGLHSWKGQFIHSCS